MAECPDQDNSEPLKYKTWVLRVSIHCEGCKRKVKRILHSVEGVYTIDVDTRQHRVVVTGNVDANTLLRKLEKSGKHAELWPDSFKNPNNFQQQQQQDPQNQNPNVVEQHEPQNGADNNNPGQQQQLQQQQQQQQQVKEVRFEANIPANGESQKPPGNNNPDGAGGDGGGGDGGGGGGGGAAKKKKKKKKGHNSNNSSSNTATTTNNNNNVGNGEVPAEQVVNGGPQSTESYPSNPSPPQQYPNPGNLSPPRQQHPPNTRVYEYAPPTYYAPQPVHAVSYNTAYPSSSYSASYYSAPPPPNSYAYLHQGGDMESPAPLDWNLHAAPPSDTFEIFSDENPNACSIM